MKLSRGASQILFGYLPGQTVDLSNRVWLVEKWNETRRLQLDQGALRRAILQQTAAWDADGDNDGLCRELREGVEVEVLRLNRDEGVTVELFPKLWRCRTCGRITQKQIAKCYCGAQDFTQLPFVQFHDCGALGEPALPARCGEHHDLALRLPGSSSLRDLVFYCPKCMKQLGRNFRFVRCDCGRTPATFDRNLHRAGVVFTARFAVLVNSVDPEITARLRQAGGAKVLEWVLEGMDGASALAGPQTSSGLIESLVKQGISRELADTVVAKALERGEIRDDAGVGELRLGDEPAGVRDEALGLAAAVEQGRVRLSDLAAETAPALRLLYTKSYPGSVTRARLAAVDLIPRFPVATVAFGYTRGDTKPGKSRLVAFREKGLPRAYGDMNLTEALLFRLDPVGIHNWLERKGALPPTIELDPRSARLSILRNVYMPSVMQPDGESSGDLLLRLVHTYAHRVVRRLAAYSGIDRDAIGEYLFPHHLSFAVFTAARGFVLGGLQAVYETMLDTALADVVDGESRCALDPGCASGGGACVACLHLSEASCRLYNQRLDRAVLFGDGGYLR
jgi:hypothetical protein